jgi:hypothetical protein
MACFRAAWLSLVVIEYCPPKGWAVGLAGPQSPDPKGVTDDHPP